MSSWHQFFFLCISLLPFRAWISASWNTINMKIGMWFYYVPSRWYHDGIDLIPWFYAQTVSSDWKWQWSCHHNIFIFLFLLYFFYYHQELIQRDTERCICKIHGSDVLWWPDSVLCFYLLSTIHIQVLCLNLMLLQLCWVSVSIGYLFFSQLSVSGRCNSEA